MININWSDKSKIKIICASCCILACIAIVYLYRSIDYEIVDSIYYYDDKANFHYISGLGKPISCMVYIVNMIIIILMLWIILKSVFQEKNFSALIYIKSCAIYLIFIVIFIYGLFDLEITHIVVTDKGFYVMDNLMVDAEFNEYQFNYFDNHLFMKQANRVYIFQINNNEEHMEGEMERFVGLYSINTEKLINEIDKRTNNKYMLKFRL